MTRRNHDRTVADYPPKLDNGSEILGVDEEGSVVYWDPVREVTLSGDVAADGDFSKLTSREDLTPVETVEEVVAEIEDTVGWSSLSEKASEVLDGDESSN